MVNKHNPRLDIAITNLLDTRYIPQLSLVPAKGRDLRTTFSFHL
jgi:outer membrane receptor protein involved in Fe transport